MQTHPPTISNNVKLKPLQAAVNSTAYNYGFLNLSEAEPSLGIPSNYTITQPNTAYYFPVFAVASNYLDSRKFTGYDNLVFVNNNLGYNNRYPIFNIDINGTFHALSAYIERLSAELIVPANGNNTLNFNNYGKVVFDTDVYFNNKTFAKEITASTIFTDFLSAKKEISTTIYTIYYLTGAYVTNNVVISGSLTATNVFASQSIITPFLSASSALFLSLTSNNTTITDVLSVQNDIYAKKIYGQIDYDPFCEIYYNEKNQLSINPNRNYVFAVRPSDDYSTDNINVPRTLNGDWWSDYGNIHEDRNVSKPYFKNLQPVFDYVYKNGIEGNNLTVYIDEDIIEGEIKPNYFTSDNSGGYAGCTVFGNLTAAFYTTEYLGSFYPHLTSAGIKGGDFIWGYDNNADIAGVFSYIDVLPLRFKSIDVHGRWDVGDLTRTNGTTYYTLSGRRFTDAPRKVSFRSYVCANPRLSFNTFTDKVSTWTTPKTKTSVQGRQVSFKHDTKMSLNNLCFEFETNSIDSTGLVFYNGQTKLSNITVALLGKGIYSYGALNLNSVDTYVHICGSQLGDPSRYTPTNWNNWVANGYNFESPTIYPGYGLAIVGNNNVTSPSLINFGNNSAYTGFINVNNGAMLDKTDYNTARKNGRNTQLNTSIILDGKYNAYALYKMGDNSRIQGSEYLFVTDNFALSSNRIVSDNLQGANIPTYNLLVFDDPKIKFNFKYIDFDGTFSILDIKYYLYTTWAFNQNQGISSNSKNSYLNIYNGDSSNQYKFELLFNPKYINLSFYLNSFGYLNKISTSPWNTEFTMSYVGISDLYNYKSFYNLKSPFDNNFYMLNYYSNSVR
jgi:hypothetical protein